MSETAEEALDDYVDRRLSGEEIDLEAFLKAHSELREEEREELRTLASTLELSWVRDTLRPGGLPASIGPYRVLSRLGRGGQGEVYLVEDALSHPDYTEGASGRAALARLRREVELVTRLDHPGICKLYECGSQDGRHYVAMQLVEGQTLARWIVERRERGGLAAEDVPRALEIAEQVARALHAAHEAGVVHRDVKPGNIMLVPGGGVVLLDFGLAKGTTSRLRGQEAVTETGRILGSPAYLSPEQLAADGSEPDRRTDVYALGVSLYECLTLRRPFEGADRARLFERIRRGGPPDPGHFDARLDRRFRVLLEKALEPDREHRYASALAFADDLGRLRRNERLVARAPGPLRRTTRWMRGHPRGAIGAATLLLLGGCLFLTLLFWRGERRARIEAGGDRLLARARARLASNPSEALLLAIEGAQRAPGPMASTTLLDILGEQCERRVLRAHETSLELCLPGRGGRTLITASAATLRVWDAATWKPLRDLEGHTDRVCDAALSPDGLWLASLSVDGQCRVWSTDSWSCARVLDCGPSERPCLPGFDALGRLLTADGDGTVRLWDARRGELLHVLGEPGDELTGAALDGAGRRVLGLTRAGGARVWELGPEPSLVFELAAREPGEFLAGGLDPEGLRLLLVSARGGASLFELASQRESPLESLGDASRIFAFAPRGGPVLVGRLDGTAALWDSESGAYLRELRDLSSAIQAALFSADGARVLVLGNDFAGRLCDPATGSVLEVFRGHETSVVDAFFDPCAGTAVTADGDGTLREWQLEAEARRATVLTGKRDLVSAHLDRQGKRVVCAGSTGWVQVVPLAARRCALEFQASEENLHGAVFAAGGTAVLTASSDRTARLWDAASGAPLAAFEHPAPVWDAQESPDGDRILTAAQDGRARVWDARTGELQLELVGHEGGVRCARFYRGGQRILTTSETPWDKSVRLWEAASGAERAVLRAQGAQPISVSLDPSGRFALTGSWWGEAELWDLESETLVRAWRAHASHVVGASISPDALHLLTSSSSPVGRLWNLGDGAEQMTLDDGRHIPTFAEFSPDGRWILSASGLGRIRLWPADPLARARELATHELTEAERARLGL